MIGTEEGARRREVPVRITRLRETGAVSEVKYCLTRY
jgi:hypothetical protein